MLRTAFCGLLFVRVSVSSHVIGDVFRNAFGVAHHSSSGPLSGSVAL